MKLINKNILLISPEPWSHIFVSKHHYATHLATRGNKLFFLNPPSNTYNVMSTDFDGVSSVYYRGFPKGLRFYPKFLQRFFILREFLRLQKLCNVRFDIVWSFDNSVFFDFSALPDSILSISHIVDLNQHFNTGKAASTAKVCFGVIPAITERLSQYNKNTYYISHGVNSTEHFERPVILPGNNNIKALYIGNLAMKFIDWSIIQKAAVKQSNIDFVFLGSNKEFVPNYITCNKNVYILDAVSSADLWSYLKAADIFLLAYTKEYYNTYASPHKFWEYLAVGKPIITSFTKEYLPLGDLVYMSNSAEQWSDLIDSISKNLAQFNTEELILRRRAVAADNSYEKKIQEIEKWLTEIH